MLTNETGQRELRCRATGNAERSRNGQFGGRGYLMTVGLSAEMEKHARAAVEMVREEYGHELDFSEPTIGAVESMAPRTAWSTSIWSSGRPWLRVNKLFFGDQVIKPHYVPAHGATRTYRGMRYDDHPIFAGKAELLPPEPGHQA